MQGVDKARDSEAEKLLREIARLSQDRLSHQALWEESAARYVARISSLVIELQRVKKEASREARSLKGRLAQVEQELRELESSRWSWLARKRLARFRLQRLMAEREQVAASGIFDPVWYRSSYPDVALSNIDPLEHYLRWGWMEGRNPCAKFDTDEYLLRYPDVKDAGINPLVHYVQHGRDERRWPRI